MSGKSLLVLVPPGEYTLAMPNLGDRALHAGMRELLAASGADRVLYDGWNSFPRMTLQRLPSGRAGTQLDSWLARFQRQCAAPAPVQQALSDALFGPLLAWLPVWPVLDRLAGKRTGQSGRDAVGSRLFPGVAARRFGRQLAASDAVVMNAGGLLADHLGRYLPGRIFALAAAQAAGRPTALLNYSFAVTRPELLEWVAPVIRRIDLHAVRESTSRERLLALGVPDARIHVVPDAAFAAGSPQADRAAQSRPTVAIQVRGDRGVDIDAWVALIAELRSRHHARVIYLCGCLKYDPPVLARLQATGDAEAAVQVTGEAELKRAIGAADLLVTDRYHGMVFATQMGTPFLPLATTSHKSSGFIADLGYPLAVQPALGAQTLPATLAAFETLYQRRASLAGQLRARGDALEARVYDDYSAIFARLFALVRQPRSPMEYSP